MNSNILLSILSDVKNGNEDIYSAIADKILNQCNVENIKQKPITNSV
jgi:hypothetical protein